MSRPKKKKFEVYNIMEVSKYLISKNKFTEDEYHTFWLWWCDGDSRTGPCDRSLRNVPIGYWGWTDDKPQRQLTAAEYRAEQGEQHNPQRDESLKDEKTIYKVLEALHEFFGEDELEKNDNLVYMAW